MTKKTTFTQQVVMLFLLIASGLSAQTITTIAPTSVTHRSAMTVTGTGFTSTSTVRFYTTTDSGSASTAFVAATSVTFVSAEELRVIVPAVLTPGGAAAVRAIRVFNGTAFSPASTYTFVPPATTPAGSGITQIVTNYNGSWVSGTSSLNSTQPDTGHSVVGFRYGGVLYSTGSENAVTNVLSTAGFASGNGTAAGQFTPGNFRALPIRSITGTVPPLNSQNPNLIVLGNRVDGSSTAAVPTAPTVAGLSPRDVLIDGIRGLGIGTGVTNLPSTAVLNFQAGTIVADNTVITDNVPDILVSQIASPSTDYSVYCFVDASGNIVGNPVQVAFTSVGILGTYKVDFFTMPSGAQLDNAVVNGWTTIGAGTRDIRMVGYKLSDFGITPTNKSQVATFKVMPSGTSDPAFMAYNRSSFEIPAPEINTQPVSQAICPGGTANFTISVNVSGTEVEYRWEKNGVPLNNGATGTGSTISGATTASLQISGITSADAGVYRCLVVNSAGAAFSNAATLNAVVLSATGTNACVSPTNSTNFIEAGGQGINIAYQWYSNGTTNSNTGGTAINGATSSTYFPPINTAGTRYYYAKIYNTGTSSAECTAVFTNAVAVNVAAGAVAGTPPANRTVCNNNSTVLTATGTTGNIQWQQSANGSTGWANVTGGSGATTASYTTPALTATTYYRYVVTSANNACSVTSATITATVTNINVWTGAVSTMWNTAGNWACGVVPTLTLNARIPVVASNRYPIITGSDGVADCLNLTVETGASVTVNNGGDGTLRVAGTITNTGTIDVIDGTIVFIGTTAAQTIPANVFRTNTVRNLTIYNAQGVTNGGTLDLTGILDVELGLFTTGNSLTLKSNAATTAVIDEVTGSITGTMTIERYIPARRAFRFVSSPTTGGTIQSNYQEGKPATDPVGLGTDITGTGAGTNGFDESGSKNPSMFRHNNNTSTWEAVTSTLDALNAGEPYRLMVRGDRTVDQHLNNSPASNTTLRTRGTIVTGPITVSNLSSGAGLYNLVGNPYQAPVNMQAVLSAATNLNTSYYVVWDPTLNTRGAYVTVNVNTTEPELVNNNIDSDANKYVQPHHAFFVQTQNTGTASLTFNESNKYVVTNTTPTLYSTQDAPAYLKLSMYTDAAVAAGTAAADGFVVTFASGANNGADAMDAIKAVNQDENVGLMNSGLTLSYESRNLPTESDVINISNTTYRTTNYTYKVKVSGMDGMMPQLHDKYTNTITELPSGEETSYAFSVDPSIAASSALNRFDIIFRTALNTGDNNADAFSIYPNPVTANNFTVQLPEGLEKADVSLFNQLGQEIQCNTINDGNLVRVEPVTTLADGVYMVKVSGNNKVATKKLIVK